MTSTLTFTSNTGVSILELHFCHAFYKISDTCIAKMKSKLIPCHPTFKLRVSSDKPCRFKFAQFKKVNTECVLNCLTLFRKSSCLILIKV